MTGGMGPCFLQNLKIEKQFINDLIFSVFKYISKLIAQIVQMGPLLSGVKVREELAGEVRFLSSSSKAF